MKFGETLQQQSSPAFKRHNIDYDDIKLFIKDRTTPGAGKAVSIPGRSDERLAEFENDLFIILKDQHDRIGFFVKCKVGEVQRRQDDCNKLLQKIAAKPMPMGDRRATMSRLQRYGRLEGDVIRAADELKSLARFSANQRTAFRKLLKKYRKWTGSADLEDRFREAVLDDPKSFTKLDLGPMLDEYSSVRQRIRQMYENAVQQTSGGRSDGAPVSAESSVVATLRSAIESQSVSHFDASMATVPLGRSGAFATYFVHPDNVVELQMFLLQSAQYISARSRSNSLASPVSPSQFPKASRTPAPDRADHHLLAADCLDRFAEEQSALTVTERERSPGSTLQRAKAMVCWNNTDDAVAMLHSRSGHTKTATFKSKRAAAFFDRAVDMSSKKDISGNATMQEIREELSRDDSIRSLFQISCCRSRLVGLPRESNATLLMTLDTDISIHSAAAYAPDVGDSAFPFAILTARHEGSAASDLIQALDESHLVERVRGFSLEYHAVWQIHQPSNMSPPFWLPILSRDIRKLPPPAMDKRGNRAGQGNQHAAHSTASLDSGEVVTDSTTAVETTNEASQFGSPPLRFSTTKKKVRKYADGPDEPQVRYWSEYDHPEDGDDHDGAYMLYVDPHERSVFDRFFDKAGRFFGYGHGHGEHNPEDGLVSPATDDETSSDEATGLAKDRQKSYGTIRDAVAALGTSSASAFPEYRNAGILPHISATCFVASLIILGFAYIMAFTGRHKYISEVQAGVIAAVVACLVFVITGCLHAFRNPSTRTAGRVISVLVLVLDGVGLGGLLARYLF